MSEKLTKKEMKKRYIESVKEKADKWFEEWFSSLSKNED